MSSASCRPLRRSGVSPLWSVRQASKPPFGEATSEIWEETLGVSLTGSFLCARHSPPCAGDETDRQHRLALRRLRHRSSGLAAYNVSKYGVIGLTGHVAVKVNSTASRHL
jgi:NAD(P)-dependent dehydrogenase (short-subunit alcohol dehydrogenase family)